MHFLINEKSFIGQAKNIYETNELITEIVRIIKEINKIKGSDPLQTHSTLSSGKLSSDLTLYQWLQNSLKSRNRQNKTLAQFLIQIINKGPFVDVQGLLNNQQYLVNKIDVSDSSIAGAVILEGTLISLQNAGIFSSQLIEINYQNTSKTLNNLTEISHAKKICPRYNPHPKHDKQGSWQGATKMDLSDQEAQIALNKSIEYKENQRFSYYNNKFYRFHFENVYDEQGYPTYHGYPVSDSDVPNEIKSQFNP